MAHILVTGGAGFIAGALAQRLCDEGHQVVVADNLITGNRKNIPISSRCTFIEGDVNHEEVVKTLFKEHSFDYVFHYAALVGVQRTLENPIQVLKDIDGIKCLLNYATHQGVKRFFYSSSSEVYGEPVQIPQHEVTTPLNSRLPYAIVKNVGEAFLRSFGKEKGLNYTIFRFFNTYGPTQSDDFVISKFIRLARANEPITIYGDGSQTRTFCFIDDNIDATMNILNGNEMVNDVINIGSDREVTILELAKAVISSTGSSSKIVHLPPLEEGDMKRRRPDNSRMKNVLQRELISLESGLQQILKSR